MTSLEADPLLRRLERRALVFCGLAAAVSLAAQGGRPEVALGVVGGGVLIGVSYWAIRSSIDGVLALGGMGPGRISGAREEIRPGPIPQGGRGRAIGYGLRFVGRYALLAGLAYVMLVWLRLHPVGLILGVSSIVVAAAIEAASTFGRPPKT